MRDTLSFFSLREFQETEASFNTQAKCSTAALGGEVIGQAVHAAGGGQGPP